MSTIYILGTRGIPNRYGGFERLVEVLAPHLAAKGHRVTVFCEAARAGGRDPHDDEWHGVRRRYISPSANQGLGTLEYDLRSYAEVESGALALVFGYGTALFQTILKGRKIRHAVNMDGMEWKRAKWSRSVKLWLRLNERIAATLADVLIADHPAIQKYLDAKFRRPSRMIPYGADLLGDIAPSEHALVRKYDSKPFFLVIARAEPENQIHVVLDAYARSSRRALVVVIGDFDTNAYGRALKAAHPYVEFPGAVYDKVVLDRLRRLAELYIHGHSVGGTNPSLVEAMAAGAFIAAHDNPFNRWVAGSGSLFFRGAKDLTAILDGPVDSHRCEAIRAAARLRCAHEFEWSRILLRYEEVVQTLEVAGRGGTKATAEAVRRCIVTPRFARGRAPKSEAQGERDALPCSTTTRRRVTRPTPAQSGGRRPEAAADESGASEASGDQAPEM